MDKLIKFIKSFLILIILFQTSGCNIAAGSYPYAEGYEIDVNESDLIKAIQDFKKDNPQYIVPEQTLLKEGRSNQEFENYWYHVYFYYNNENTIVHCWTRPTENGKTELAFVATNKGLQLGNWKTINKDFGFMENREEKKKFEERILNKIKKN